MGTPAIRAADVEIGSPKSKLLGAELTLELGGRGSGSRGSMPLTASIETWQEDWEVEGVKKVAHQQTHGAQSRQHAGSFTWGAKRRSVHDSDGSIDRKGPSAHFQQRGTGRQMEMNVLDQSWEPCMAYNCARLQL